MPNLPNPALAYPNGPSGAVVTKPTNRVVSIDAYRGLVMCALAAHGFGLAEYAQSQPAESVWRIIGTQFDHAPWRGCRLWDLIQPSFMFIVGAAMAFSVARRTNESAGKGALWWHAIQRSVVLVALGTGVIALLKRTFDIELVNVLVQIGLGYPFLFACSGLSGSRKVAVGVIVLAGYWLIFASFPVPIPRESAVSPPHKLETPLLVGFEAHWGKHTNFAAAADRVILNALPRQSPFVANTGGYQTLNFIPAFVTMLLGLLAGCWLQTGQRPATAAIVLMVAGLALTVAGVVWDQSGYCPSVKRIWTPSWVLVSGGICLVSLAVFHTFTDLLRWKAWAFPLVVAGANSILLYITSLVAGRELQPRLTQLLAAIPEIGSTAPIWSATTIFLGLWAICWQLYRKRIFLRI